MITSFQGEYRFLSNFYPCEVGYEGMRFPTVEHAYQAAKTLDPIQRLAISKCATPGQAKRMGRTVIMRTDWNRVKNQIMLGLVRQKFANKELQELLLSTYPDTLIEGNTWGDRYWGAVLTNGQWQGRNELGRILMNVRSEIKTHYLYKHKEFGDL